MCGLIISPRWTETFFHALWYREGRSLSPLLTQHWVNPTNEEYDRLQQLTSTLYLLFWRVPMHAIPTTSPYAQDKENVILIVSVARRKHCGPFFFRNLVLLNMRTVTDEILAKGLKLRLVADA